MAELTGEEISRILASKGNVVKCVMLRAAPKADTDDDDKKPPAATDTTKQDGDSKPPAKDKESEQPSEKIILTNLIDEIQVDTTPKKSEAQKVLGGPITFLGQYEDEDLVLICRRPESLEEGTPWNPHKLQPPFENTEVQGNILIMRTKPHDEDKVEHEADGSDVVAPSDDADDFFVDFSKDDYIQFALRNDVEPPEFQEMPSDNEEEAIESEQDDSDAQEEEEYLGESDDEDDEETQVAMMNLIMAQVLRRFQDENGRGPNTQELLELRSALAQKLGVEVPEIEGDDAEQEAKSDENSNGKRAAENGGDEGETKRVKFSQEAEEEEPDQKQKEADS